MFALNFKSGVILVEMLVNIIVIGCILTVALNLMTISLTTIDQERVYAKQLQIDTFILDDLLVATDIKVTKKCLEINTNDEVIQYCFKGDDFIRTSNGSGFERLISNIEGEFVNEKIISIKLKDGKTKYLLPIWSMD